MAGKRTLLRTLLFFYVFLRRRLGGSQISPQLRYPHSQGLFMQKAGKLGGRHRAVVCSLEGGLLRSSSTFPYFMLVSLEAGGLVRALLLLLLYPFLCCVNEEVGLRVMTVVCFRGIKERDFMLGRSVLPKHMLEDVGLEGFQLLTGGGGRKVCVTGMPRVMVEASLKEYLGVEVVVGRELKVVGGHYTGIMEEEDGGEEREAVRELFGKDGDGVVWVGGCKESHHLRHRFFSKCKEMFTVSETDKKSWHPLTPDSCHKQLVFHDGRIAFRPTPVATLAMFLWLPLGLLLAILRTVVMFWLPYKLCIPFVAVTGMTNRLVITSPSTPTGDGRRGRLQRRGRVYACNHRTLLDPVYVSGALGRPVTALVYSVSPVAEVLSPIRTVRLTRDREEDRRRMERELRRGDVVVCPEGTTCREPYLLRFSRLFAEVAEEGVVPVALRVRMAMFYGTTAGGRKWMDPVLFAMDPFPSYSVEFLDEVKVVRADGTRRSSHEMANQVQGEIARALGFECTMLTRRDKYLMLAGNEGFVKR